MFSKPNAIVYLRRSGIVIAGKHVAPARLQFPPEVISNLDVLSRNKLIGGCRQFFIDHDMKGKRVLVVLDDSVVFSKLIELDKAAKPDLLAGSFIDAMPFESGKRACLALRGQASLELYATNADLYQSLSEALHQAGVAKVLAVTPAPAYDLGEAASALGKAISHFLADTRTRSDADFLSVTPA